MLWEETGKAVMRRILVGSFSWMRDSGCDEVVVGGRGTVMLLDSSGELEYVELEEVWEVV